MKSLLLIVLLASTASAALNKTETAITTRAGELAPDALSFLESLVNQNSGTKNLKGVRKVGGLLRSELDALGFTTRWADMPKSMRRAGHLIATRNGSNGKRILLIGHMDTVFKKSDPFQRLRKEKKFVIGPGVNDMKGGLAVMIYALKAMHASNALKGTQISIILHGDEEDSGDPLSDSRADLIALAKKTDAALGFEYAVDTLNKATIARRGSSSWKLVVEGKRGHSSRVFSEKFGAGAIYGISDILSRFYNTLSSERYLTFNPGQIIGGTKAKLNGKVSGKNNVIAQTASVSGDLRALSVKQRENAKNRMRAIAAKSLPGTKATLSFHDSYPPMSPSTGNKNLLKTLSRASEDIGYGPVEALDPGKRGAADTSFAAPYTAAIDGLGLLGDGAHSEKERIEFAAFEKALKRSALFLYRLTR